MDIRQSIVNELDSARERLLVLITPIDSRHEIYPGWTVKELLAHITGWDTVVIDTINCHLKGTALDISVNQGIDEFNAISISKCEGKATENVWNEFHETRKQLIQILLNIPPERFEEDLILPWGRKGKMVDFIRIFSHHELEHEAEILAHKSKKLMNLS